MNAQLNLSPSSNHFNRLTDRLNCAFLQCKIEGLWILNQTHLSLLLQDIITLRERRIKFVLCSSFLASSCCLFRRNITQATWWAGNVFVIWQAGHVWRSAFGVRNQIIGRSGLLLFYLYRLLQPSFPGLNGTLFHTLFKFFLLPNIHKVFSQQALHIARKIYTPLISRQKWVNPGNCSERIQGIILPDWHDGMHGR